MTNEKDEVTEILNFRASYWDGTRELGDRVLDR